MNQAQLESYLGRPLTSVEVTNLKLYLKISVAQLEELICTSIKQETETRTFDSREDYRTVFTDIFTEVESIEIDGDEIDVEDYSIRQWDRRNGDWYNSIVFDRKRGDCEIDIIATWGFDCYPADLQLLLARLFDLVSKQNNLDREVNSKSVEDFSISFNHSSITMNDTLAESFVKDNSATLGKYSMCNIGEVRSGSVRGRCYGYDRF